MRDWPSHGFGDVPAHLTPGETFCACDHGGRGSSNPSCYCGLGEISKWNDADHNGE
jgi:hypothetical protein